MLDLKEVLIEPLHNDIRDLVENNPHIKIDYLISNLYVSASLFTNNRVNIKPYNHPKINTNIYLMNIGGTGTGKSQSAKPFITPLGSIQKDERIMAGIEKQFVEECTQKQRDSKKPLSMAEKNEFARTLLNSNPIYKGVDLNGWTTVTRSCPEFYITDFTPEALGKINFSDNKTALIYCDEYDKLINSVTRTRTVNDPCQFFTSLFDGEHVSIIRKGSDSESIDISLSLMVNTTIDNFKNSVNKNGFFGNGFGARFLYVVNMDDYQRRDLIPINGMTLDQFNGKMEILLRFLYDFYYKTKTEYNLVIPVNLFEHVNKIEENLENLLDDSELDINMINAYKTRLRIMLLKLVALTEIINYTYTTKKELSHTEIYVTDKMINRGAALMKFFINNFIELFSSKKPLKPDQEALLAQLTKGRTYAKEYLLKLTKMSEPTLRRFVESRNDLFESEIIDRKKHYKFL